MITAMRLSYGVAFVSVKPHLDGLEKERRNSSALATELRLSSTYPLICVLLQSLWYLILYPIVFDCDIMTLDWFGDFIGAKHQYVFGESFSKFIHFHRDLYLELLINTAI